MSKLASAAILVALFAGSAMAQDSIVLKAKMGDVTFPHKMHQQSLKNCKLCHEKAPGKIEGFGKDVAHKLCIDCHKAKKAGPVSCKACHKK